MPYSESITIDRTGTGGDYTSSNPPLATWDGARVPIYWGDAANFVSESGSGTQRRAFNTTYKLTMSSDIAAVFIPDSVFNALSVSITIQPSVFKNGETVIIRARNFGPLVKNIEAGELLGHLYFIDSKFQLTMA